MKQAIPTHPFAGEQPEGLPIRYVPLHVRNDYDFARPHRHDYFELFFFTRGGGTHHIDFDAYPVADHSAHLIYPGQVHLLRREPDSYGSVIHFTQELFMGLTGVETLMEYSVFIGNNRPEEQQELEVLLRQLEGEYERGHIDLAILKTYLQLLLQKCLRFSERDRPVSRPHKDTRFLAFKQLVEAQFRNHASATHFAAQLGLSERKLNEICHTAIGNTANAYIRDRILLEAKRLLSHSGLSVKEISFRLGFDDPSYFNRFFRKNVGMPAGEFKAKLVYG